MFAGKVEVIESIDSTNILTDNDSYSVNSYQPLQEIEVSNYPRSTGSRRSRIQRQKVLSLLIFRVNARVQGGRVQIQTILSRNSNLKNAQSKRSILLKE
jgi:hypothetical protein